ncbi:Coenzyme F420 hydrogenase/dehydrogenase, beta subunit C-terminal domain [Verrucomicrobiota bacterium]
MPDTVASGGAVTAVLHCLLNEKKIDCVVAVGMDEKNPARAITKVVTASEGIERIPGSCYQVSSHAEVIPRLHELGAKIAFVGLPCHVQSLRKFEKTGRRTNVVLTLGIFCGFNLLPQATDFLLHMLGRRGESAVKVEYRGGKWPGGFRVRWSSGRVSFIARDDYSLCDLLYLPEFCRYCVDLACELADLSFGDAWYHPGGWSTILVRTESGKEAIENAAESGCIELKDASLADVEITQSHLIAHKKAKSARRMNLLSESARPRFLNYNLEGQDLVSPKPLFSEGLLRVARGCFRLLPLPFFKLGSRLAHWLAVRFVKAKPLA